MDYQEYLAWLDEGNQPTPYKPPPAARRRNPWPNPDPELHWTKPDLGGDAATWGNVLNTTIDAIDAVVFANQQAGVPVGSLTMCGRPHHDAADELAHLRRTNARLRRHASLPRAIQRHRTGVQHRADRNAICTAEPGQKFPIGAGANVLGAVGGTFSYTLATANLPPHNHPASQDAHNHAITTGAHAHGIATGGHSHAIHTGAHAHTYTMGKRAVGLAVNGVASYFQGSVAGEHQHELAISAATPTRRAISAAIPTRRAISAAARTFANLMSIPATPALARRFNRAAVHRDQFHHPVYVGMSTQFRPLEIPPGVVAKATKQQRSSNWAEVNLMRWVEGQMAPVGGQSQYNFTFASRCKKVHGCLA